MANIVPAQSSEFEGAGTGNWVNWFSAAVAKSTTQALSGTGSLEIATSATSWGIQLDNWPGYSTGVVENHEYEISWGLWVPAGLSGTAELRCYWRDEGGTNLAQANVGVTSDGVGGWYTSSAVLSTSPAGTTRLFFELLRTAGLTGAATYYVDSIVVDDAPSGASGQTVSPTGIASGEAFGTAAVTTGPVTVSPAGIASAEAVGSPVVSSGFVVQPSGIASAEAVGSPTVTTGNVTVSPSGIGSGEQFGTASVNPGPVTVSPSGIASGEAFGTASVSIGAQTLSPSGISSSESFGSPTITTGPVTVSPSGIPSSEAFGSLGVTVAERVWQLVHPSTTENWPWYGKKVIPRKREQTVFGDDSGLYTTDIEGYTPAGQGDDYRAIPDDTKYVWYGGHVNTTTDPDIKDLWIANGFSVVEVT